jgi:hypothetical protein
MSARELQQSSERIRERAGRQYIADRATLTRRELQQETDEEIRQALRSFLRCADDPAEVLR